MWDRLIWRTLRRHPGIAVNYCSGGLRGAVRRHGPDSRQALIWRQERASALYKLERYAEAEPEFAALTASSQSIGDDHLALIAMRGHAYSLCHLGRPEDAEAEYRTVADESDRLLGPEHPDAIRDRQAHANLLAELGRYAEAEKGLAEVIARRTEAGDADNAALLEAREQHAAVLYKLGLQEAKADAGAPLDRCAEAEKELARVITTRAAAGEADSTTVLKIRAQRAEVLSILGRLEESHAEWQALAEEHTHLLGPNHPDTLLTRVKHAETLRKMGLLERAAAEYGAVARKQAATLGSDHPDTRLTRNWHDHLLQQDPRPNGNNPD